MTASGSTLRWKILLQQPRRCNGIIVEAAAERPQVAGLPRCQVHRMGSASRFQQGALARVVDWVVLVPLEVEVPQSYFSPEPLADPYLPWGRVEQGWEVWARCSGP